MTDNSMMIEETIEHGCEQSQHIHYKSYTDSNWIQKSIKEIELKSYPSAGLYVLVDNEYSENLLDRQSDVIRTLSDEETAEFNIWRQAYSHSLKNLEEEI